MDTSSAQTLRCPEASRNLDSGKFGQGKMSGDKRHEMKTGNQGLVSTNKLTEFKVEALLNSVKKPTHNNLSDDSLFPNGTNLNDGADLSKSLIKSSKNNNESLREVARKQSNTPSMKSKLKEFHSCPKCGQRFAMKLTVLKHLKKHGANLLFKCQVKSCDVSDDNRQKITHHLNKAHPEQVHPYISGRTKNTKVEPQYEQYKKFPKSLKNLQSNSVEKMLLRQPVQQNDKIGTVVVEMYLEETVSTQEVSKQNDNQTEADKLSGKRMDQEVFLPVTMPCQKLNLLVEMRFPKNLVKQRVKWLWTNFYHQIILGKVKILSMKTNYTTV